MAAQQTAALWPRTLRNVRSQEPWKTCWVVRPTARCQATFLTPSSYYPHQHYLQFTHLTLHPSHPTLHNCNPTLHPPYPELHIITLTNTLFTQPYTPLPSRSPSHLNLCSPHPTSHPHTRYSKLQKLYTNIYVKNTYFFYKTELPFHLFFIEFEQNALIHHIN